MGRGKTQLRRIEDGNRRAASFCKRKNGLLKKAFELSVLCEAEVGLAIFSQKGKLHEFSSSSSMLATIERYREHTKGTKRNILPVVENTQIKENKAAALAKKLELLEVSNRKLLGGDLESCTNISKLQEKEQQLEKTIFTVRAKKMQVFTEHIEQLKEKGKSLEADNAILLAKCEDKPLQESPEEERRNLNPIAETSENLDVDVELFLGPREKHIIEK